MSAEEDCFVTDAAAKHERLKTGSFIYGCTRVTFKRFGHQCCGQMQKCTDRASTTVLAEVSL